MSDSKIAVLQGGMPDLIKNPSVFDLCHVFQCSPLPTIDQVETLICSIRCEKCSGTKLWLLDYAITGICSAFIARCLGCHEPAIGYFCEEPLMSADIIVMLGSSKEEEYRQAIPKTTCPICKATDIVGDFPATAGLVPQAVLPARLACKNCGFAINIVIWDYPKYYFKKAKKIFEEALSASPKIALVFAIGALETYLQKVFIWKNNKNAWLVSNRKVSFQDISKAEDLFKTFFEIDLSELAGETNWRTIKEALGKRNCIIHNGGLDKNHDTIHVTKQCAIDVMAAIEILVDKAENKLKSTGLLFGP